MVTLCSTAFAELGRAQAQALGYPELSIAIVPHPFGSRTRDEIRGIADTAVADVVRLVCEPGAGSAADSVRPAAAARAALIEAPAELELCNRLFEERGWSDGLPLIPPTVERVQRMLQNTTRAPEEIVAAIAPGYGAASVEGIAINAVMAGASPGYLPLLLAAAEAVAAPQFNLQGIQASTHPAAVWLIINGPLADRLAVNGGSNCLGQGARANATLGRALRLILQNIGGARPGVTDRATHGQPGKYTFCCAENEQANPWPPLHVERGFAPGCSTVTVVGAAGTTNMLTHSRDAAGLMRVIGDTMAFPTGSDHVWGGEPWIVLAPEHAQILKAAGLSKSDVKRRLWEQSKLAAGRLAAEDLARACSARAAAPGEIRPDTLLAISHDPDDIGILVAGGAGTHSVYIPVFANSRSVTRLVASS